MNLDRDKTHFTCAGEPIDGAPRCPGVYRFFSDDGVLLYVGKSVDIGTRLNSHFADARDPGRQQRMMTAVARVDCELTAGDVGAQLIENAAIKAETPLYNRRQRRSRKLWTQRLTEDVEGFLQVVPSDFSPAGERCEAVFGLFRSRHQIHGYLRKLARDEGLCLRVLGAERGAGPCFQSQIGRCRGACAGKESPQAHNARLLEALERQRIAAWPFAGPVLIAEMRSGSGHDRQPARQYHVLSHWSYLGSYQRVDAAQRCAGRDHRLNFDRDTYRIIFRALRAADCAVLDASSGEPVPNPFAGLAAKMPEPDPETMDGQPEGAAGNAQERRERDRRATRSEEHYLRRGFPLL